MGSILDVKINESKNYRRRKSINQNNRLQGYFMMAPQLILFAMFMVYPVFWIIYYSFFFYNGNIAEPPKFTGLNNFFTVFNDGYWWKSVMNTLVYTGKILIELPLALILAVLLEKGIKGKNFYKSVLFLPCILSVAVMAVIFNVLLNGYNGAINEILQIIGVIKKSVDWFRTETISLMVIMAISIWQYTGLNMTFFMAGLTSISKDLYESAELDGANELNKFIYITVPVLKPITTVIIFNSVIGSLREFSLPFVLTGRGGVQFMMVYMYDKTFGQQMLYYGLSSAIGVMAALVIGTLTFLAYTLNKKLT